MPFWSRWLPVASMIYVLSLTALSSRRLPLVFLFRLWGFSSCRASTNSCKDSAIIYPRLCDWGWGYQGLSTFRHLSSKDLGLYVLPTLIGDFDTGVCRFVGIIERIPLVTKGREPVERGTRRDGYFVFGILEFTRGSLERRC